jgi:hypothetical protein
MAIHKTNPSHTPHGSAIRGMILLDGKTVELTVPVVTENNVTEGDEEVQTFLLLINLEANTKKT